MKNKDHMSEAEALTDIHEGFSAIDYLEDREESQRQELITQMKERYNECKKAKIGSNIMCPTCGSTHTKTTYHKVFCRKGKRKNRCKDVYWNTVDERRFRRACLYK